ANQGHEGGASCRRADTGWNKQTAAGTGAGGARGEPGNSATDCGAGTVWTDFRNAPKGRRSVAQLYGRTPRRGQRATPVGAAGGGTPQGDRDPAQGRDRASRR